MKKNIKIEDKNADLKDKLENFSAELKRLRLEHSQGKLKNTSFLTLKRKEIARLLTAINLK